MNKTQTAGDKQDWSAFLDERAAIGEHDGGLSRNDAEARAFECCVVEWMNLNPEPSEPGRCASCGKPDDIGSVVVPFGTSDHGHTWLHHDCWPAWRERRRQHATEALAKFGLTMTNEEGGAYTMQMEALNRHRGKGQAHPALTRPKPAGPPPTATWQGLVS